MTTKAELMGELDYVGVSYKKSATKPELEALVEKARADHIAAEEAKAASGDGYRDVAAMDLEAWELQDYDLDEPLLIDQYGPEGLQQADDNVEFSFDDDDDYAVQFVADVIIPSNEATKAERKLIIDDGGVGAMIDEADDPLDGDQDEAKSLQTGDVIDNPYGAGTLTVVMPKQRVLNKRGKPVSKRRGTGIYHIN